MSIKKYLDTLPLFEVDKYDRHQDLSKHCVAFTGTPRKHPYDTDKMILIFNPFSSNTLFYEFRLKDIEGVDETANLATENGESMSMIKIWVKKGSIGLKYEPFEVGNPLKYFTDSEVLHQAYSDSSS